MFFIGAVVLGALILHPACLAAGLAAGVSYYFILRGREAWKFFAVLAPLHVFITAINPILNTRGNTVLTHLFGRPYTLEALYYGAANATVFVITALWIACTGRAVTTDRITSLLAGVLPSLSLVVVMALRMIPNMIRKAKQIAFARSCVGKSGASSRGIFQKMSSGAILLGGVISFALEGGIATSDSMRSRGFGTSRRTAYSGRGFGAADAVLAAVMLALAFAVGVTASLGMMKVTFLPDFSASGVNGINIIGFASYAAYVFLPSALCIREEISWSISKYKI